MKEQGNEELTQIKIKMKFICTILVQLAWHLHKQMTLNYAAIYGEIKCVLYDDRPKAKLKDA